MLTKLWKIIDESGFFKKDVIRNWKIEKRPNQKWKIQWVKLKKKKNTLEGMNSRLTDTEEGISDLEDRIVKITQWEQ